MLLKTILESKMTAGQRHDLPRSQFGLPEIEKYPMPDKKHVMSAMAYFRWCPAGKEERLAVNIYRRHLELDMPVHGKWMDHVPPRILKITDPKDPIFLPYYEDEQ